MYRFKSIKYLTATGLLTAILFVVGYLSSLFFTWAIAAFGGTTTLQLFDALYLPFCAFFKGPMMLFAGAIAGALFDLVSGVKIVSIPATIVIRVLMFLIIKLLSNNKWWSSFYSFLFAAAILIFGYPLYYVMIYHDKAIVISELIVDSVQGTFAYLVALPLYYYLDHRNTNNHFWDDSQFDYLKRKQKATQEIYDGAENGNW